MNESNAPILVIGGTGKTGKRVVQGLHEKRLNVRVGSRSGHPAFDWDDTETWEAALHGVKAVYLTYFPDLAVSQAPSAIRRFCKIAKSAGTEHIVLLSGRGEPAAQHCEQIVQDSGMDWTIIRASWFNQNFNEGAFNSMVEAGVMALPIDNIGEPFIDANDIADVALSALTDPKHRGQLYEVTGPRLLTFADVADELTQATGKKVRFLAISTETFTEQLTLQQVPKETIGMLLFLFKEVLDGRNATVCDGVERALGRPATDFSVYAANLPKTGHI
ncbi:NAD(P)H-binding protein [Vibrio sp. VB16]|uniref:NAD(P)H-binding protein n=1 Tax=Vibrio sp. VB16 TaxID=2785746 RepID=UPI00189DDB72|nr:NAD(P)H-binding protein [Vibrio sp. VB16]UGA57474.1 NmrA family NAD(P)-binding protein [Vibrio sp. VB16]